jgi:predicted MFS family arabinose efflux permease
LAIGIQIHHSAGLLGLVIGEYVTWRFGFSTLLYLGIPLLVGLWLQQRPNTGSAWRNSAALFGASGSVLLLVLVYARLSEPLHPAWNFAKSMLFSLSPILGLFSTGQ